MPLPPGTRLGPYEIVAPIGAGGMGEVYRARDTRLDRTVAVKVLAAPIADQPEMRERFDREARAVSSLNHPHICTLHDVGHQDGIDFLVMEYLEGETLSARLAKGPLPVDEALRHAVQIAGALDKAHSQGIFHRDLKPGNIMLTESGAKLLDFGLAKLREPQRPHDALATMSQALTQRGSILGTLQYMAPEQLEGKETDGRTDIFAFGAVIYEMVTGRKAFEGQSQASVIAAILERDPPPLSTLQVMSPPLLDQVVKKCLVKSPEKRWQSAQDLSAALEWVSGGSQAGLPAIPPRKSRAPLAWGVAVAGLLTAFMLAVVHFRESPPASDSIQFSVSAPAGVAVASPNQGAPVVSPDGRQLAFTGTKEGQTLLYVRSLNSLEARPLPGTANAYHPFWSPDSRSIGFFAEGKLKRVDLSGGSALALCSVGTPRDNQGKGAAWNRDGVIIFATPRGEPLYRVSAAGGQPARLTTLDASLQEESHRWPYFLPDGKHFLYLVRSLKLESNALFVGSLDSQSRKFLFRHDSSVVYAETPSGKGYLLFARDESLMAQAFDASSLKLKGELFRVPAPVDVGLNINRAAFSVSENNVLAYSSGVPDTISQLIHLDRTGKESGQLVTIRQSGRYPWPRLSPDGRMIAYSSEGSIWLLDLDRRVPSRFVRTEGEAVAPIWSPAGDEIVFTSLTSFPYPTSRIYRKALRGTDQPELLVERLGYLFPGQFSPDGASMLFTDRQPTTGSPLLRLPTSGERKLQPLVKTDFRESQPRLSPDGHWLAYVSDESGQSEVYVRSFPSAENKFRISTDGGFAAFWRRDGKELVYLALDRTFRSVTVGGDASLKFGVPRPLFKAPGVGAADMSADGQQFFITTAGEDAGWPITVVLNWTAELKR